MCGGGLLVVSPRMVDQPCFPAHTRSLLGSFTMKKLSRDGPGKGRQLNIRTGKFLVIGVALLKIQLSHSRPQPGIHEVTDSTLLGFQDFLESSAPDQGKILLKTEVFPAKKGKSFECRNIPRQEE
jgi:hypothetical protein